MAIRFVIRGDGIQLDQVLKASGLCQSGGAAKGEIAAGMVKVDGAVELRKRAQLRAGQVVEFGGETIELAAPGPGESVALRPKRPAASKKPAPKGPPARPGKPKPASGAKRPPSQPSGVWPRESGPPTTRTGERQFAPPPRPGAKPSAPRYGPPPKKR